MTRAFISYSRRNTNFAERLARDLSDAGVEVWIDFRQIHAGEKWKDEIRSGIERSEVFVLVLSPDSVGSEWVQFEIEYARKLNKQMLPVMALDSLGALSASDLLRWMLDVHFIKFENRYEQAFPELLKALPGKRRVSAFDTLDPSHIPNPFKGLEAFQQTDAAFFFGREVLVKKAIAALKPGRPRRFLAVVGASGSGKSSMVRAGVIPGLRAGAFPNSELWRMAIFTPGDAPLNALATRLAPFLPDEINADEVLKGLQATPDGLHRVAAKIMADLPAGARLLLVIDQFEEAFTRASDGQAMLFLEQIRLAATQPEGRATILLTMRADFFDRLGRYPEFAELFEQDSLLIVPEMTPANLLRAITGPAEAVGLRYDDGLPDRILEDVRRQPGSLPLLQYALKELYDRREKARLTHAAYDAIGGVEQALAGHAEGIYSKIPRSQQDIVRRVLLRLVEISEAGESTRRRVPREEISFRGASDQAVQEVIDLLTAPESRLLVASREIRVSPTQAPTATVWIEVGHEALIREWDRFQGWIADDLDNLRTGADLLRAGADWVAGDRDAAYLLVGTRLDRAEEWLTAADATNLQRDYIRASVGERERREEVERAQAERELALQKRASARLRGFVGVLIGALVITAGLVVFAFSERTRAEESSRIALENAQRAEEQARIATENLAQANSFALAAQADRALGDGDGDLAIALAVESNVMASPPPAQARLTLAEVAFAPGTRLQINDLTSDVRGVALSPDGLRAAVATGNGLRIYNALNGELLEADAESAAAVAAVAYAPSGEMIALGDERGGISILESGQRRAFDTVHIGRINTLEFDSTGTRLLSASNDNIVILWNAANGAVVRALEGHAADVIAARFLPGRSDRVVSASTDGSLRLWNAESGELLSELNQEGARFSGMDLRPDGQAVVTATTGGGLSLFRIDSADQFVAEPLRTLSGHTTDAGAVIVRFSPDARLIASGSSDGRLLIHDTETGSLLATFALENEAILAAVEFGRDGSRVLAGGSDSEGSLLRLWDVVDASVVRDMIGHTDRSVVDFMVDHRLAVSAGRDLATGDGEDDESVINGVRVWDIATGRTIQQLTGHTSPIVAIAASPTGSQVVTGSLDKTLRLWDLDAGESVELGIHEGGSVSAVAWLPDGVRVLSAGRDGRILLWNTATLQQTGELTADSDSRLPIQALALSPDGRRVVTGGDERVVRVWDVQASAQVLEIEIDDRATRALAFAPSGETFAVGTVDGSVTLYDLEGEVVGRLTGHPSAIRVLEYSNDGLTLLSAAFDGTIRVWDLGSGFEVRRYVLDDRLSVNSAVISADEQTIITGLTDGRVRLWRLYPTLDSLLAWTFNNRFVPEISCAQREQFRMTLCDPETGSGPSRPAVPLLNPPPATTIALQSGMIVEVNTTNGSLQNVRRQPGAMDRIDIVGQMQDGEQVTLLQGPVSAGGFVWWEVLSESELQGWTVAYIADENLQTLVPLNALN
jgi:WD40 repeat protein